MKDQERLTILIHELHKEVMNLIDKSFDEKEKDNKRYIKICNKL